VTWPDGTRLVFVSLRDDTGSDLFTVDIDGSDRRGLTDDPTFETLPIWSPAGDAILFLTRDG
jgi:Tol biopolymer transport system component